MAHSADDTRHRLLEAAGEVFARKGFKAATVREICALAGTNLAAVNYHFGDKEALYVEAVRDAHFGDDEPLPEFPPGTSPEQKLREHVHQMFVRLLGRQRPAWHAQLLAREMAEPTQACAAMVAERVRARHEALDEVLRELLPPSTPAVERHLIGFSIIGQCLHFKIHRPIAVHLVGAEELATYDIPRLTEHVTRLTLAALGRAAPLGTMRAGGGGGELSDPNPAGRPHFE